MPKNPNMQKLGKRKNPPAKEQPSWLFPSTENATVTTERSDSKDEKHLAKKLLKQRADSKNAPLFRLIGDFLAENKFTTTKQALQTESNERGVSAVDSQGNPSLSTIYAEWLALKANDSTAAPKVNNEENGKVNKKRKEVKRTKSKKQESSTDTSSDDSSDVEMVDVPPRKGSPRRSSSVSSSSSSSDSDADDETEAPKATKAATAKTNGLKRKAASSSSEFSSSSSDSSSESDVPKAKKLKTKASSPPSSGTSESSSEDSSSGSSSSSESEGNAAASNDSNSSSSSDDQSSSESESESDSDSSALSLAKKTPLPGSDSDNSSESDTDSESDSENESSSEKKPILRSESSATLSDGAKKSASSDDSSDSSSSDSDTPAKKTKVAQIEASTTVRKLSPPLPPEPVAKKGYKKSNVPFSRISKDQVVDERLASNAFVPYDYAQKAHEDLIVTRGKGFTKEKNKKKRGSYRGGMIDIHGKKGIRFDD